MTTLEVTKDYEKEHRIAVRLLSEHDHKGYQVDQLTRESCGACVLNGYHPKGESRDFINYAGWARVYIQAGKMITHNLYIAFLGELASDNRAYADALRDDILHYGMRTGAHPLRKAFVRTVNEVCGIYE